ncbi:uncharacterized protein CANTADRAFT_26190 [Suhomyces tanzawaensis NRRL Y-17324]|uniref:Mitochondrial ribosomal protein subunit L20 n=1 Tax=Suhomyces tanzawaensis NRRL Y-17324 TaxID=984487 RepID=A0A1E4SI36_9ASCO|nr:uncharacterized protein CANTADRAFT_26190 [Suhomyces tanzawaensis NRRL Y-17324]ODV79161.1 hypothetical protein CANTADRAFT_26190 [Suhomyces tanzawaensis NRRL Y-17324]
MMRTSIRNISKTAISCVKYEPIPINQYNQARSAFNIKPKKTQGLVHNPPAAISKPSMKTPKAFLPESDPRRNLPNANEFTKEQLENYPVINRYEAQGNRSYEVTPEIVEKIVALRSQDPKVWTISKLSKEFNIDQRKVNVFTGMLKEKVNQEEGLNERQLLRRSEMKKRTQLWLRGEF